MTERDRPSEPILVLGGTAEARALATTLVQAGIAVVTSLAGRVDPVEPPAGALRVGGFGGPDALARWLTERGVRAAIDATHPFAARISQSAATACRCAGVPLLRLERPAWREADDDRWHRVAGFPAAASLVPRLGGRIFLTIGRQSVGAFAGDRMSWYLVRCIQAPGPPVPPRHLVLLDRGPFDLAGELALLDRHQIDVLVTKDSGGQHTVAKLEAARQRRLPVVIVSRPPSPDAPCVRTVSAAVAWVASVLDGAIEQAPTRSAAPG